MRRDLFSIVQSILARPVSGSFIKPESFRKPSRARLILKAMVAGKMIECTDVDSWRLTASNPSPRPRTYRNSYTLSLANRFSPHVRCAEGHRYKNHPKPAPPKTIVVEHPTAGVPIPPNVKNALEQGTGFVSDWIGVMQHLENLPVDERLKFVQKTGEALPPHGSPIQPATWNQSMCGRIYARQPAIQNLPSVIRHGGTLSPINFSNAYSVDLIAYDVHILMALAGEKSATIDDIYDEIAARTGWTRDVVKGVFLKIVGGQRENHIFHDPMLSRGGMMLALRRWEMVMKMIESMMPKTYRLLLDDYKTRLYRTRAEVFFAGYSASLGVIGNAAAGIPIHDELIFPAADMSQAEKVRDCFRNAGQEIIGRTLPAKISLIA